MTVIRHKHWDDRSQLPITCSHDWDSLTYGDGRAHGNVQLNMNTKARDPWSFIVAQRSPLIPIYMSPLV